MRRKKRYFSRGMLTVLAAVFAFLFLMPTVLTITNSFMTQSEITANYGQVFQNATDGKSYIKDKINLKFIPDKVSFSQYFTVLLKSPDFLYKFWNSVILVAPIVLAQLAVASVAAYGFTRWRGKIRDTIFFAYVILDAHALSGDAGAKLSGLGFSGTAQHPLGNHSAGRVCAVFGVSAHQVHAPDSGFAD